MCVLVKIFLLRLTSLISQHGFNKYIGYIERIRQVIRITRTVQKWWGSRLNLLIKMLILFFMQKSPINSHCDWLTLVTMRINRPPIRRPDFDWNLFRQAERWMKLQMKLNKHLVSVFFLNTSIEKFYIVNLIRRFYQTTYPEGCISYNAIPAAWIGKQGLDVSKLKLRCVTINSSLSQRPPRFEFAMPLQFWFEGY